MGAGVIRVKGTSKALALSVDGNARFVYLDPFLGAQHAVAEAARNVACAGGLPIGATNCLNFGNPQRPEIMWQFARAVEGIGAACRALDIPITGGNVSLYNETDRRGVLPTPVLGVVGLLEDATRVVRRAFRAEGDAVVLLGRTRAELGGSEYLNIVHHLVRGVPPALDLVQERRLQALLVELASEGLVSSAHDCAEGGLAVTLAECCFDSGLGVDATLGHADDLDDAASVAGFGDIATLLIESASRVLVSTPEDQLQAVLARATASGVPAAVVGRVGGERIRMTVGGKTVIDESRAVLEEIWSTAIERYFERRRAIA
jgi:phosphoribosylformylglycinamidine synthase